jgi:hypothetical protein
VIITAADLRRLEARRPGSVEVQGNAPDIERRTTQRRSRGGMRTDLGIYVRSIWEANYARYLNYLVSRGTIAGWTYEPKTFQFRGITRGTRDYTPDFRVDLLNGGHEWHEVKGWLDPKSKTRLKRMARYFPDEHVSLVQHEWFARARRSGLAALIPGWESGRKPLSEIVPAGVAK